MVLGSRYLSNMYSSYPDTSVFDTLLPSTFPVKGEERGDVKEYMLENYRCYLCYTYVSKT